MNAKTIAPVAVAVALATVAAFVAKNMTHTAAPVAAAKVDFAEVAIAAHDLTPGSVIASSDLKTMKVEQSSLPEGAATDSSLFVGRVVRYPILSGQTLANSQLAPTGATEGLAGLVPEGKRAVTIEINEFTGVAGFLKPGVFVDLIGTLEYKTGNQADKEPTTRTVVQNVQIIAVGPHLTTDKPKTDTITGDAPKQEDPIRSVTLLVTPEQAQAVELACTGRTRLVLRSSGDEAATAGSPLTVSQLIGGDAVAGNNSGRNPVVPVATTHPADEIFSSQAVTASKPLGTVRTLKVIRGGVETEVTFDVPAKADPERLTDTSGLSKGINE